MKYLVTYLREYARKYLDTNHLEVKTETDKNGNVTPVWINEKFLFNEAADRIEFLEARLKELEKIDKVLKMLEREGE